MPDDIVVESIERRLEVALLELLVDPSIYRHVGMFCHFVLSFLSNLEGTPPQGDWPRANPSGDPFARFAASAL
jgi:hypothetical protein